MAAKPPSDMVTFLADSTAAAFYYSLFISTKNEKQVSQSTEDNRRADLPSHIPTKIHANDQITEPLY